ncbi:hypothetical protein [Erythrobacter sp.]|uniref:hypothetical protein n=1 Tax=Erythrobacter sp. TaxID=1042 RepID=UPI001425D061|nr:hypothetical protein [Erythrobacter sp.]QIQ87366.1 MAG: hypothetical protein G9473_12215 [Erythrobacter sp.]
MRMPLRRLDWFLVLPLIAGLALVAEIDPPDDPAITLGPFIKGAVIALVALLVSLAVAAASAIDRRCTEEYAFQIMANAALVAVAATMLTHAGWIIAGKFVGLPALESDNVVGVMVIGWIASYYWFRLRGIAA